MTPPGARAEWAYEDFAPGLTIPLGSRTVTREEIIRFASAFNQQPMHIDEEAARDSILGRLSASGFHTCSILMRLLHEGFLSRSTSQGAPGVDRVSWPHPVHPGDTLTGTSEVLERRLSRTRPGLGLVVMRHTLANQHGETVAEMIGTCMFLSREAKQ